MLAVECRSALILGSGNSLNRCNFCLWVVP
jgi:hypothetical protein